jgi:hypothetical protein
MMAMGLIWLCGTAVLIILAWIGGIVQQVFTNLLMGWPIPLVLQESAGTTLWTWNLYYVVLFAIELVLTYLCFIQPVTTVSYYPEV